MKQECIMKEFDFITSKTLDTLTEEQYDLFRDYLKICGLRVIAGYGEYEYAKKHGIYLDGEDLVTIYPTMIDKLKNEITLSQILQTINTMTTVQMKRSFLYAIRDYKIYRSTGHGIFYSLYQAIRWAYLDNM